MTTLPHDWSPLREAAEVVAREAYAANVRRFKEHGWSTAELHGGDEYAMEGLRLFSLAQADLLADLTRPASRDFWARWLAERVGMTVGATAPTWVLDGREWRLIVSHGKCGDYYESTTDRRFGSNDSGPYARPIVVLGIADITDPAAALCAALLAVVPHAE